MFAVSSPADVVGAGAALVVVGAAASGLVSVVVAVSGVVVVGGTFRVVFGTVPTTGSGTGTGGFWFSASQVNTPPVNNAKAPPNNTGRETCGKPAAFFSGGAVWLASVSVKSSSKSLIAVPPLWLESLGTKGSMGGLQCLERHCRCRQSLKQPPSIGGRLDCRHLWQHCCPRD
jgi:hypothetical protein